MQTNCAHKIGNRLSREFHGCVLNVQHGSSAPNSARLSRDDYTELMVEALERRLNISRIDDYVDESDDTELKVKTSINGVKPKDIMPNGTSASTLLFTDKRTGLIALGVAMEVGSGFNPEYVAFLARMLHASRRTYKDITNAVLMVGMSYMSRVTELGGVAKSFDEARQIMLSEMCDAELVNDHYVDDLLSSIEVEIVTEVDNKQLRDYRDSPLEYMSSHGSRCRRIDPFHRDAYDTHSPIPDYDCVENGWADIGEFEIEVNDVVACRGTWKNKFDKRLTDLRTLDVDTVCNLMRKRQDVINSMLHSHEVTYAMDVVRGDDGKYVLVDDDRYEELINLFDLTHRMKYDADIRKVPVRIINMSERDARNFVNLRKVMSEIDQVSKQRTLPSDGSVIIRTYTMLLDAVSSGRIPQKPSNGEEQQQWVDLFDGQYDFDELTDTFNAMSLYADVINEKIDDGVITSEQRRTIENAYQQLRSMSRELTPSSFTKAMQSQGVTLLSVVRHILMLAKAHGNDGSRSAYLNQQAFNSTVIACIKLAKYDNNALRLMSQWVNGVYDADYEDFKTRIRAIREQPKNAVDRCFQLLDEIDEDISKLNVLVSGIPTDVAKANGFNGKNATALAGRMTDLNNLFESLLISTRSLGYLLQTEERGNDKMRMTKKKKPH